MILRAFKIPLEPPRTQSVSFPIGVEFIGATDDGVDITCYYLQKDQSETREKPRKLEIIAPYTPPRGGVVRRRSAH